MLTKYASYGIKQICRDQEKNVSSFFYSDQAEEVAEDIEADDEKRAKRQAYRDRRYPLTLWANGVNYFFHPNASLCIQILDNFDLKPHLSKQLHFRCSGEECFQKGSRGVDEGHMY